MKKSFRNTSFLVELLINILIFSISCAILVSVFGKASQLARTTREENFASAEIHTLFELAKARGVEALGGGTDGETYYDKNWNAADSQNAAYGIEMDIEETATEGGVLRRLTATARRSGDGSEICTLETTLYNPQKGGAGLG